MWVAAAVDLIIGPHKLLWFLALAIFVFFLLCTDTLSIVCLYTSFMCMFRLFFSAFGEFHMPPIGLFSGSVWMQISLKQCWGRRGKTDHFSTCGRGLRSDVKISTMGAHQPWCQIGANGARSTWLEISEFCETREPCLMSCIAWTKRGSISAIFQYSMGRWKAYWFNLVQFTRFCQIHA